MHNLILSKVRPNNNYTKLVIFGFLKEYSILGNELKEKVVIKIKVSDESLLGIPAFPPVPDTSVWSSGQNFLFLYITAI